MLSIRLAPDQRDHSNRVYHMTTTLQCILLRLSRPHYPGSSAPQSTPPPPNRQPAQGSPAIHLATRHAQADGSIDFCGAASSLAGSRLSGLCGTHAQSIAAALGGVPPNAPSRLLPPSSSSRTATPWDATHPDTGSCARPPRPTAASPCRPRRPPPLLRSRSRSARLRASLAGNAKRRREE
jgi:hypothetical protein